MSHNPNRTQTATRHTVAEGKIILKNRAVTLTENGVEQIDFTVPKLSIETVESQVLGNIKAIIPLTDTKIFVVYSDATNSFAVIHNIVSGIFSAGTPLQLDNDVTFAKGIIADDKIILAMRYTNGTGTIQTFSVTADTITNIYTAPEGLLEYSWDIVRLTDTKIILKNTFANCHNYAVVTIDVDNSMTFENVILESTADYLIFPLTTSKFYSVSGNICTIWSVSGNVITKHKQITITASEIVRNMTEQTYTKKEFIGIKALSENKFIAVYAESKGIFTALVTLQKWSHINPVTYIAIE